MCNYIISVWLAVRHRPRENYDITYKSCCLHISFDSVFQSDIELPPVIHCVACFSFEYICKDLGESTAPMVHHRERYDNYSASEIRLNKIL